MKDFINTFFIEPFREKDLVGILVGILMGLVSLTLLSLLLWFFIWIVDTSFLTIKEKEGTITNKYYVPAHKNHGTMMVGKILIPTSNYVPDTYYITIVIDGKSDDVSINYKSWILVEEDCNSLCCKYTISRIFDKMDIEDFCQ